MSSAEAPEIRGGLAFGPLWRIARRDLGRNRRRSLLSMLAVALGLALLIAFNGLINGVMDDMRDNTIRYDTGHLQLRRPDYDADSLSLRGSELVDDLDARLALASAMTAKSSYREALEGYLEVVRRDRGPYRDRARKDMLSLFTVLGDDHELTQEYRPQLAILLF